MTMRAGIFGLVLMLLPGGVLAVGPEENGAPAPSPSTTICPEGTVWDIEEALCVPIAESGLVTDPDALIATARELAHAGRHGDALALLARAPDPEDTMVLTYIGYSTRNLGYMSRGLAFYDRALAADPDNLLARSYLGMAYLILGTPHRAEAQLVEIRTRGGVGSWPERALAEAIAQGSAEGFDY